MADKPFDSGGEKDDSHYPPRGGVFIGESSSGHGRMASEPNTAMLDVTHMEGIIHQYEIEAYKNVLTVFRARANTISWEQEVLLTDLRKELRVTSEENLSISRSASAEENVQYMRVLRESRELQPATLASSQLGHDQNSRTSRPGDPSSSFYPQPMYIANQPSTSARTFVGAGRNYPSSGVSRGQFGSHISSGGRINEPAQGAPNAVGRRLRNRSPDDHNFYEAVITDYNPREISPGNRQWLSNDAGTSYHGGYREPRRAMNQARRRVRGRPQSRRGQSRNDCPPILPLQDSRTETDEIQLLDTDRLVREVERVFSDSNSTPQERAYAASKLREQEQSLTYAIARLNEVDTNDDTDEGMGEQARHDLPLSPRQDSRIGPDENQIRDTDSVLMEAERVLNDDNSTAEEKENAVRQLERVLTNSNSTAEQMETAHDILEALNRNALDDDGSSNSTDGEADKGKGILKRKRKYKRLDDIYNSC